MKSLIILVLVFIRAFLCTSGNLEYKDDISDKKSFLERILRMIETDSSVTTSTPTNLPNLTTTTVWPNFTTSFSTAIPGVQTHLQKNCANYSKSTFESSSRCIACDPAKPGQFPWQVEIVWKKFNFLMCGGSLITSKLVLTAAHCTFQTEQMIVKLGQIDRKKNETGSVISKVSRKFVHPKFIDDDIPTISPYDIAILELEISVEMSDTIQPACIANYKNIEIDTRKGTVVTSGWGSTVECSSSIGDCNTPDILQGTEMFLLSRKLCNMHMKEANVTHLVTEEMICANDHSRVCKFDSGGGLIKDVAGKATIIGIVSWGKSGCPVGRPAVYTNVAKFSNWIEEIISDTNITTSTTKN